MNLILPTIGRRGDVQPYIALALGLRQAGHSVTLATHPCMRGLVESYGVAFAPIGPGEAQPSWIQVLIASADWREETITWDNAPLAYENLVPAENVRFTRSSGWKAGPASQWVLHLTVRFPC